MKGIIFGTESIHGILDGRKTMTQEVAKSKPVGYMELKGGAESERKT